jgi:phage repressor protein C with HTH and peptisase S24 domain
MKTFTNRLEAVLERAGLKELRQKADALGVSYEYARKIFNDGKIPADDVIVTGCEKAKASDLETREILLLAATTKATGPAAATWTSIAEAFAGSSPAQEPMFPLAKSPHLVGPDYVAVPMMTPVASAGPGCHAEEERISDAFQFNAGWLQSSLRVQAQNVRLIHAEGDSMAPAIQSGDILMVDVRTPDAITDGIYVIRLDGSLLVKRLQRRPKGVLRIISDNPAYEPIDVDPAAPPEEFKVCGRVVWFGRRV